MLTTFDMDEYVYEALRAGASGFLLKDVPPEQLVAGIRAVASGDALPAPSVTRRVIEEFVRRPPDSVRAQPERLSELTARESRCQADRPRPLQRGDREGAVRQRDDREDVRSRVLMKARPARPRPGRRVRVRIRARPAGLNVRILRRRRARRRPSLRPSSNRL